MASLGHVAVGLAAGRLHASGLTADRDRQTWRLMVVYTGLSLLPDADVIAFRFGIPYAHPFGHRGASHALLVALGVGLLLALRELGGAGWPYAKRAGLAVGVALSHGLLDTLTDGGLGVALFWPFSAARYFAPWTPIPVSPIGAGLLSMRGLYVLGFELVLFSPLLAYALWPRRRPPERPASE